MGDEPIIIINQCLHGYQNGHQLLASSFDISPAAKRIILFQSDLSGTLGSDNFENYITGYPLPSDGYYAFAKTWYAYEMKRPGCVWTQTLIIDFSDLGKIPELSNLLKLFIRPQLNKLSNEDYTKPIELKLFETPILLNEGELINKSLLVQSLYNDSIDPVFISSSASFQWEKPVTSIWSDQWPRLRRTFTFCTGALGKKEIYGAHLDLQIGPSSTYISGDRVNSSIKQNRIISEFPPSWINLILKTETNQYLRKFLWLVGSDIEGSRLYYLPLVRIFDAYLSENVSLSFITKFVVHYFPNSFEARSLKRHLYGYKSLLPTKLSEYVVVNFLLKSADFPAFNIDDLKINDRLSSLIKNGVISIIDLISLWKSVPKGRIDVGIWDYVNSGFHESIYDLIHDDNEILSLLLERFPKFAEHLWVWETSLSFQKQVFYAIQNSKIIVWPIIFNNVLKTQSLIVIDLYEKFDGELIYFSLDWLNSSNSNGYTIDEWNSVLKDHPLALKKWIHQNNDNLSDHFYDYLVDICSLKFLHSLDLSISFWKRAGKFAIANDRLWMACYAFSAGAAKKDIGGDWLVADVFQYIYDKAEMGKLGINQWTILPKENYEENNDWFLEVFSMFGLKKKIVNVYEWDYCEVLIRTIVHLFIKYPLSKQAFANSFNNKSTYYRAISYCCTLRKGKKFILQLYKQSQNKNFKIQKYKIDLLQKIIENY